MLDFRTADGVCTPAMRVPAFTGAPLAIAICCGAMHGARADWIREFKAEGLYNSNVSRSNRPADRLDDFALGGSARVGKFTQLADGLRLAFTLDLDGQFFAEYQDLNNASAGATASLRYRFGLGARALFVRAEGSVRWADFDDELQDGVRTRVALVAGKRVLERLELQVGYVFDQTETRTELYDQEGHAGLVRATFDLTDRTQLSAEYSRRHGQVISYAVPPRPDLPALANVGLEVNTFGTPYVAYNLDATTQRAAFSIRHALTQTLGLSLSYEWQQTSRSHVQYLNHVVLAAVQFSF